MSKKKALSFKQALFLSARNVDLRFQTGESCGDYCSQDFNSFDFWINQGSYANMCSKKWYIQPVTIPEKHEDVKNS